MLVTTDTKHQWARFVIFGDGFGTGFPFRLGRLLGLLLFLLLRGGGGIFKPCNGIIIAWSRRESFAGYRWIG